MKKPKKIYDIEFSVTKVSHGAGIDEVGEVVHNFVMESTRGNEYGYLITGVSMYDRLKKDIMGSFIKYRGSSIDVFMWGCLLQWDRHCKKDTIYMMTSNDTYDLYGKVKVMFREIRKEKLDVR